MTLPRTLSSLYRRLKDSLVDHDARTVIKRRAGLDWTDIIANPDYLVNENERILIESDMQKVIAGVPVSRIFGRGSFWGLEFLLGPDTLDPRQDTETVVERALKRFEDRPPQTILDLGTGSGCMLVSLLSEWPDARGVGTDRTHAAVCLARMNAALNGVADRASFVCADWCAPLQGTFDLIVSNPPYITSGDIEALPPAVKNHDPILALDGGEDGLAAFRVILTEIKKLLSPSGAAFFEIGFDQSETVPRLVEDSGLSVAGVYPDMGGIPRVVEISCGDK